jgi:activator of HSP90 ATPase
MIEFEISGIVPAAPQEVYEAWLNSDSHTAMTGSPAHVTAEVGGEFEAWNGYISGKNLELLPTTHIVQSWRTAEFTDEEPDSRLEIIFQPDPQGTKVLIRHTNLPAHGEQYKEGWKKSYFAPMQEYFSKSA